MTEVMRTQSMGHEQGCLGLDEDELHAGNGCVIHESVPQEAFPPAEEALLLELARRQVKKQYADRCALQPLADEARADIEEAFGIADIQARVGGNYPRLSQSDNDAVLQAFAEQYHTLPTGHARYKHAHHDHHEAKEQDHSDCGKRHGLIQRNVERFKGYLTRKIKAPWLKPAVDIFFKGLLFTFCPGDDIATIGLKVAASFQEHTAHTAQGHEVHAEERPAVLPGRPRIDFVAGRAVVSLSADVPVRHAELPLTPAGNLIRSHVQDPVVLPRKLTKRQARKRARIEADNEARWQKWLAAHARRGPQASPLATWADRTLATKPAPASIHIERHS